MAIPFLETVAAPFTAFNFSVEFAVAGVSPRLCNASFAECDGLEVTLDVKTIREGGNNGTAIRLAGPTAYGQLTLKRGMTANFDAWSWMAAVTATPSLRADGEVVVLAADGRGERARFMLSRCLPVRVKAPALNAKDGMVAIEEMTVAYDRLTLKRPDLLGSLAGGLLP